MRRLCILLAILALSACAPQPAEQMSTGTTIPAANLPGWKGDAVYGQVSSAWLKDFHARWKADLFSKGVVRWDGRFDCNRFAAHFAAAAQIEYYTQNFHSWTAGQAAAVGEVWYLIGGQKGRGHSIVLAYTERGPTYFEPQTGKEVALSAAEQQSIYLTRF
jgi:hypothetical protein